MIKKRNRISVPFLVLGYGRSFADILENHFLDGNDKPCLRLDKTCLFAMVFGSDESIESDKNLWSSCNNTMRHFENIRILF
jgi:hypothetical protein